MRSRKFTGHGIARNGRPLGGWIRRWMIHCVATIVVGAAGIVRAQFETLPPTRAVVIPEISLTAFEQPFWDTSSVSGSPAPQYPAGAGWNAPVATYPENYLVPRYDNSAPPPGGCQAGCNELTEFSSLPSCQPWTSQMLPNGLVYRPYLAGDHEPGFKSVMGHMNNFGTVWDVALGARVAIWRYGTEGVRPDGWEVDLEGVVFPRLEPFGESTPLIASDYRFGIPVTYAYGPWQFMTGYRHLSSHLGDEWMLLHPGIERFNYARDEIVFAVGYYWRDDFRIYADLGVGVTGGGAEPVEVQFGAEYSPKHCVGGHGAPFAAISTHLRQEVNFNGSLIVQAGWQWRGEKSGHLLRLGGQFFTGKSDQGEFFLENETRYGFGIWYDF